MEKKGFTLVELLVVISIIAMLMGILMPALAKVRMIAQRLLCGTNLKGIGTAMAVYAADFDGDFPVAGGPEARWSRGGYVHHFDAADPDVAYGRPGANAVTITASLYLLVRHAEVTPKQFVCKSDSGTNPYKPPNGYELDELWDFGDEPGKFCSYSYHMPYFDSQRYPGFPLNSTSEPASPLCADRNPHLDTNVDVPTPDRFNAAPHQYEGQNVLFLDGHIEHPKTPNVGLKEDNIWEYGDAQMPSGEGDGAPTFDRTVDRSFIDAYLVNENQKYPK